MISSDILRGYNDIIVLGLLYGRDSYGYSLIQEIGRKSCGLYQMKETTLYAVLTRLEAKHSDESAPIFTSRRTEKGIFGRNAANGPRPKS